MRKANSPSPDAAASASSARSSRTGRSLVTHPQQVILSILHALTDQRSWASITGATLIIAILYWLTKEIVPALMLRYQSPLEASKMGKDQKSAINLSP